MSSCSGSQQPQCGFKMQTSSSLFVSCRKLRPFPQVVQIHQIQLWWWSGCSGEGHRWKNDLNDREMLDLHIPTPWSWLWRRAWWRPWARPCSSPPHTRYQSHPCQGPGPPELRNWSVDFNLMYFVADSPYRASQTVLLRGETCWPAKYKLSFVSAKYDHHYCNFISNYSLSSSLSAQFYKSVLWSLPGKEVR